MENTTAPQNDDVLMLEVSSEEEARQQAATHWGIPEDEVVLNVIEEGKSFFGLFGRKMKIEARRAHVEPKPSEAPEPRSETSDSHFVTLLKTVLKAADLTLDVNVLSDGSINLSGADSRLLLAGRQGDGLKALDYIVNLMARNNGPVPHVRIDCEGFRRKREKELERIAMEAAKEAMRTRRTVYLQPMTSWERRIVHLTLKESANVETHSVGFEPGRKVAVRLIGSSSRAERDASSGKSRGDFRRSRDASSREDRANRKRPSRRRRSSSASRNRKGAEAKAAPESPSLPAAEKDEQ
ncbi:MAG: R3H domain-containing nucleic acid-binding protein [Pyramidobacter sp.]